MHFRSTIDRAGVEPEGYNLSYSISLNYHISAYMVKYYQKILSVYVVEYYHILPKSDVPYFKLPYIGNLSHHMKIELSKLCK